MSPRYYVRLNQALDALRIALRDGGEFPDETYRIADRFAVLQEDLEQRYDATN